MRVAVACDHAGFPYKAAMIRALQADGHVVTDLGTDSDAPADYPDYARAIGTTVRDGRADAGVIICGSGAGVSIAANKVRGVRAANCTDETLARYAREHNGTNVIALGATLLTPEAATRIVDVWVGTPMREPRYIRRLAKIRRLEQQGS